MHSLGRWDIELGMELSAPRRVPGSNWTGRSLARNSLVVGDCTLL